MLPICVTGVDKKLPALRDETITLSNDSAYWLLWGVNGPCLWQKKIVLTIMRWLCVSKQNLEKCFEISVLPHNTSHTT